jgi:bifunctional DNase/RNase
MTEMFLAGITIDVTKACPVMVLTDAEKKRALPIWISPADATALVLAMSSERPQRPVTHDLMHDVIQTLGWKVSSVELNELSADTLLATIKMQGSNEQEQINLDARPSDAIALALRFQAPIHVSLEVLANASVSADIAGDESDTLKFRSFVCDLKASDFNQINRDRKAG